MNFKHRLLPSLVAGLLLLATGYLIEDVDAINATISGVTSNADKASIHVRHDGRLELPNGVQATATTIDYTVSSNGIYTFHAFDNGSGIDKDSVLIDTIKRDMIVTNNPVVDVSLKARDNHSGISQVRLRNERRGSWGGWQNTQTTGSNVNQTIPWRLDISSEGIRTVYAQFKDQAGNITDHNLSTHGNTSSDAPFANVVFTTEGPKFNEKIVNQGTTDSTYWVSPNRKHKIVRSNQPYVELEFNQVTSKWSTPERVYISVNGEPYKMTQLKDLRDGRYLTVEIPSSKRVNGLANIRIYMEDTIENKSDVAVVPYYYDEQLPTSSVTVTQGNGLGGMESRTYYNQVTKTEQTVPVTKTNSMNISVTPNDLHSKITRNIGNPGHSHILIEEQTRYEQDGTWNNTSSRAFGEDGTIVEGHPFTHRVLRDGQVHNFEMPLSPGFESRYKVTVTDNAQNSSVTYTSSFRQANLHLVSFKILEIINPNREEQEVTFNNSTAPQEMSAGGNVTIETSYDWLTAFEPKSVNGQIRITVTGDGYTDTQYIQLKEENILRDKNHPRFVETFTIPEDAPVNTMVTMQGYITAEMENGVTHTIYFPSQNRNISQQIGVVENDIQNSVRFNISR